MTQDRIDLVGRVFVGDEVMLHTIHGGPQGLLRVVAVTRSQVKTADGRRWRLSDGVRAWRRAGHPETCTAGGHPPRFWPDCGVVFPAHAGKRVGKEKGTYGCSSVSPCFSVASPRGFEPLLAA